MKANLEDGIDKDKGKVYNNVSKKKEQSYGLDE